MKFFILLLILLSKISFASNDEMLMSYFETSNHLLSIDEIQDKQFIQLPQNRLSKGFNFNTFWIKVQVKNTLKSSERILYLNNPTIDYITFYQDLKLIKETGDHRNNFNQKSIGYSFPIKLHKGNIYYIKIQTQNGLFVKFTLNTLDKYLAYNNFEKMFLSFFFGFILSLIIYNSFLFFTLKEQVYFYYIAFQVSIFMLLLSYSGLGYYLFWQGYPALNEFVYQRFEVLALFFALIFAQTFLEIKKHSSILNRIINFTLLLLLYITVTPWSYHAFMFQIVLIQTVLLGFVILLFSIFKKVKNAKLFFLATSFILFGTLVTFLKIFGFLEVNFITTWSVYIGSMIEAILFSIALANRINALKEREQNLLSQQKKLLEQEVQKQTLSLQSMVKDKEVLLKEVNHRVKNNLQVISSFISLASIYSKDKQTLETLETLKQRIQAIALLYSSLYKPESSTKVDMQLYIEHICKEIFNIYTPNIKLSIQTNTIEFNFDKAITLGLLVNEIVTNMIKHAFMGIKNARIELNLSHEERVFTLNIKDNGVGFDSSKSYESLGLKLIKRLSEKQLKGQLLVESNGKGSSFIITF